MDQTQALSKILESAFQDALRHCPPGRTCREVFRLASVPEARAPEMAGVIRANQAYSHFLVSLDMLKSRVTTWNEEESKNLARAQVILDRTVNLLQKSATRNTIAAIQLNRLSDSGLKKKKTDRFTLNPPEQIRYALAAEEDCQNRGLPGSDQGFLAGYHFDILTAILNASKAPADAKTAVKLAWAEGLKTARISASLVGAIKSFHHHHHAYAAALVASLGKCLMAALFPIELGDGSWVKFAASCEKRGELNYLALWTGQRARYPISDVEVSALIVQFVGLFPSLEPAIAFQRDPQALRSADRDLYLLAGLISVSNALALSSRLNAIHLRCLKDLGLELSRVDELVRHALKEAE